MAGTTMYVLHAGRRGNTLAFWAESTEDGPDGDQRPKDRGAYRFAADPAQLEEITGSLGVEFDSMSRTAIWLPTLDGIPIPSSEAITSVEGKASARPILEPHSVEMAELTPEGSVALLSKIIGKRIVAPGVIVGEDLAYLADVMRLASSLVARQQYLPGLAQSADGYDAEWSPILTAKDSERFESLVERMPGAIRAFSPDASSEPPRAVLVRMLSNLITQLVRMAVSESDPKGHARAKRRTIFDSIHDSWMHHLKFSSPHQIESGEQLMEQVEEWKRPLAALTGAQLRLCFRLEEPESAKESWFVRYMIQSRDDPSLIIPADEAWMAKSTPLPKGQDVRVFMLMSLGQASGIFGAISPEMQGLDSGIAGCRLDSNGAYKFLTNEAAALEQAGYGVMLPSWWTGKGPRSGISAKAKVKQPKMTGGILSLDEIVQFDWEIALGDKKITMPELMRMAKAKSPLVRVRGEWMEMAPDDIRRAISFLKNKKGRMPLSDVLKMNLGVGSGPDGEAAPDILEISIDSDSKDITQMLQQIDGRLTIEDEIQPEGFVGKLRPYQARGISWMAFLQKCGLGGCLADDMGLGKTIQVLALIQKYRLAGGTKPFLLICPTSVMGNWQREAARFTPDIPVTIHHSTSRAKGAAFKRMAKKHGIVVSSYGLLQRDIKFLANSGWGGIVLDEAQNIKNPHTKQAQAARAVKAGSKFALTGTPVENNVGDLWSIMEFLNPGFLGTESEFKTRFYEPIQIGRDENAALGLKRATGPFILRRLKTDKSVIADLPDKMEIKTYCTLTKEQATLYAAVLHDIEEALEGSEGIQRKGLILSSLAKLKQVCNHPAILLKDNSGITGQGGSARSGKLARLVEMISEAVDSGDRALVFTQFVEMGHVLQRHIQESLGREVLFLHGGVSRKKRDEMVQRFQSGGPYVFVISLKAGGTGLNLTAASHVFHFDRWWNPAVEDQATDRAYRIGQKRNVQVHKMICQGTLEEKIDAMIERKKAVSRKVIGTGEGWLTEMSDRDLRDLMSLDAGAVESYDGGEP